MNANVSILRVQLTSCIEILFIYLSNDLEALLPTAESVKPLPDGFDMEAFKGLVAFASDIRKQIGKVSIYDYLILVYTLHKKIPPFMKSLDRHKGIPAKILQIKLAAFHMILEILLQDVNAEKFEL